MPLPEPVEVWHGPLRTPGGRPLHRAVVPVEAVAPSNPLLINGYGEVLSRATPDTNTDGIWRTRLIPSSAYARLDAYYTADERRYGGPLWLFRVPDTGGPYRLADLLLDEPPVGEAPDGSGGGAIASYVHRQDTASGTWVANHGLGRRPVAWSLYDLADDERCEYVVSHPDLNRTVVTMDVPTAGTLYLI